MAGLEKFGVRERKERNEKNGEFILPMCTEKVIKIKYDWFQPVLAPFALQSDGNKSCAT